MMLLMMNQKWSASKNGAFNVQMCWLDAWFTSEGALDRLICTVLGRTPQWHVANYSPWRWKCMCIPACRVLYALDPTFDPFGHEHLRNRWWNINLPLYQHPSCWCLFQKGWEIPFWWMDFFFLCLNWLKWTWIFPLIQIVNIRTHVIWHNSSSELMFDPGNIRNHLNWAFDF